MTLSARVLGFFLAFFLIFFVSKTSFAQNNNNLPHNTQMQQYIKSNTNPDVPQNLHTWTQSIMIEVMSSMSCQLAGVDPTNPNGQCLGIDQKTGKIGYVEGNGGVPAFLGQMITYLYTPPVQTGEYIRYLSQSFGITKPTYAQTTGVGYNQLSPLLNLWAVFRNMVYFLFVILFVIVGVAIMLRVKIDPRTVMTIQNQIPRLIIGIIMVTFSFAIAGLMVDLMWVTTYTVVKIIGIADPAANPSNFSSQLSSAPPVFVNNYLAGGENRQGGIHRVGDNVSESIVIIVQDMFQTITKTIPTDNIPELGTDRCKDDFPVFCQIATGTGDIVGGAINAVVTAAGSVINVFTNLVTGILSMFIGFAAFLIIIIAIIYSLFKLWFALIKAYIMILIDVIFAPLWIIGGLLPGASSLGFTNWLRSLLGNLAVFPAVIALFAIGKVFVNSYETSSTSGFIPPLIGTFNTANESIISSIIALGIILASPAVVDAVKKAFKAPAGIGGLGEGLGMGRAATGAVAGAVGSRLYRKDPRTGEIRGAVGTRVQRIFGETTQTNPYTGRFGRVRNIGRATVRSTLGVEKTNELGTTLKDRKNTTEAGKVDNSGSNNSGTNSGGTPPTT